jgi:HD-like signal output (HDOD) protein
MANFESAELSRAVRAILGMSSTDELAVSLEHRFFTAKRDRWKRRSYRRNMDIASGTQTLTRSVGKERNSESTVYETNEQLLIDSRGTRNGFARHVDIG